MIIKRRDFNKNIALGVVGTSVLMGCKSEAKDTLPISFENDFRKPNESILAYEIKTMSKLQDKLYK